MLMSAQGCEESLQERTARTRLHDGSVPVLVWLLTAFSALTALLCGYECGGAPGALLQLRGQMGVSLAWAEALVCVAPGAAALSGPAGALVNGLFGRRLALLLSSLTYCVGGVMLSAAHSKEVLLLARLIVGVALGISSMTAPVYIAEVSPPRLRGQLVTFNMLFFSGGQLIACLVVGAFSYLQSSGWRYVLGLSVVPAVIQFLAFLFLPESPRWLIQKGLTQRARRSLTQIRGNQNIDEEYDGIKGSIEEEEKDAEGGGPVIWHMLCYPPTRRALAVGCGLHMFQQLAGINTVIYYSSPILQMSGVRDEHLATWLTLIPAFTNFLFAVLGLWLVERLGRRKLTLGSIAGTTLSLALLAIGLLLSAQNSPAVTLHPADPSSLNSTCIHYRSCEPCVQDPGCGFCYHENSTMVFASSCVPVSHTSTKAAVWGRCSNSSQTKDGTYWAFNYCPSSYSWIVLLGLLLYMAFYAPGLGPMPCTVNSEIYPMWARSTGNAYSAGVNWACGVLVWLSFIHLAQYLTYYGMFFLYTSFALLGFVFALGCLPETRGRRLEEMESLFENRLCTCGVSDADEDRQVEYIRVKGSNYHLSDNDTSDVD